MGGGTGAAQGRGGMNEKQRERRRKEKQGSSATSAVQTQGRSIRPSAPSPARHCDIQSSCQPELAGASAPGARCIPAARGGANVNANGGGDGGDVNVGGGDDASAHGARMKYLRRSCTHSQEE